MTGLPQAKETTISESGLNNASTNTYFTNGVEDPWRWATVQRVNDTKTQRARTSDCDDCGHCVEMYTPTDSDPIEVQQTRDDIRQWIAGIFGEPEIAAVSFLV